MVTFASLGRVGGLGNQLFQVACTISLALEKKYSYAFPDWIGNYIFEKPFNCLNNFKTDYLFNLQRLFGKKQMKKFTKPNRIYRQRGLYYKNLKHLPGNVDLIGYFQSIKYFKEYEDHIRSLFTLNKECQLFIDDLFSKYTNGYHNSVAVHVRRGDYLSKESFYPFCGLKYYSSAMDLIKKDSVFLIFSDDLEWCKNNITCKNIHYIDTNNLVTPIHNRFKQGITRGCNENNQWVDLFLMSKADHNIIANSSFSWWSSWLNANPDKLVIAPQVWFGDEFMKFDVFQDDIYLDNWMVI
ncbi:MAG: alpha-1,2-fucosyltransferase [Bacteroidetes bacterium]|nr:alpha-1,2-fucosyltransferase [Bacteroidota bacterium]